MNRLIALSLLVFTSGVLCSPGGPDGKGDRDGKDGKDDKDGKDGKKKMMPPLAITCDNTLVDGWVRSINANDSVWFEQKAEEMRRGPDFYNTYTAKLAGIQNNICLIRRLRDQASRPNFCNDYSPESLMGCPNIEDIGKPKRGDMKKKKMMCNKDQRKFICKMFQDKKMTKKVEGMMVKAFMKKAKCEEMDQFVTQTNFVNFWVDPTDWLSRQMDNQPTLETIKRMKECFPHYAAMNLRGGLCSLSPDDIDTMEGNDMGAKMQLIEAAEAQPKRFMCLVYYKLTADRSEVLRTDMSKGGFMWFMKAYKKFMKNIKSGIIWENARTISIDIQNKAEDIRNGRWQNLQQPSFMAEGREPTFLEWKQMMEEKPKIGYYLYNNINVNDAEYRSLISDLNSALVGLFNSSRRSRGPPPPQQPQRGGRGQRQPPSPPQQQPDFKQILKQIWEANSINPQRALVMMKFKVNFIANHKNISSQNERYEMFLEKLMEYAKEKKMEYVMTNLNDQTCNNIYNNFNNVAEYIVTRNWAMLETSMNTMPRNLDHMSEKMLKMCISQKVWEKLQGRCTSYNSRKIAINSYMNRLRSGNYTEEQKKSYIKSMMMQRTNKGDDLATLCDLYFVTDAITEMSQLEKQKHFGMKLMEVKKMLWGKDILNNLDINTCPDSARKAVFNMASKAGKMRNMTMDDDMEIDDDEEEEEEEEDEDEEDEDDMEDGRRGGEGRGGRMGGRDGRDGRKEGGKDGKKKDGKKMCESVKTFKICTKKLTCAYINEKYNQVSSRCGSLDYSAINQKWSLIGESISQRRLFNFPGDLAAMVKEIKKFDIDDAPCVLKNIASKLMAYWRVSDECMVMQVLLKMKMEGMKREGPPRREGPEQQQQSGQQQQPGQRGGFQPGQQPGQQQGGQQGGPQFQSGGWRWNGQQQRRNYNNHPRGRQWNE